MNALKKNFLVTGLVVIILAIGIFYFFHIPKPYCNTLRDPSGNLSGVCGVWGPSPYQKIFLAVHNYFYPNDMCTVSIETGGVDCRPFPPTTCNQSATTTPCSVLKNLRLHNQQAETATSSSVNTPFSFGELTNVYNDKEFGFSLKYPADFVEVQVHGWHNIVDNTTKARFWIDFCNSICNNINAGSLEEYRNDYAMSNKNVQIYEVSTISGIRGIKQDLSIFDKTIDECLATGEEGCLLPHGVRYVFFDPKKGFFVVKLYVPALLEDQIIQSISY
ncbi:MAG: hypothetical protein UY07_C0048G0013 [Parcubacteria group bacterium GW2011_GWA1_47_8]|nr:MAG: hypothetical protein UY07_C0048G0013 [Parcubacteria group bacterium GW2011_GWA1_47_8]